MQICRGQNQPWLGVVDDRQQALLVMAARRLRRIGRHRDHTGVQATEECRDIVRAAREQQHRPVARLGANLQSGGNRTRLLIQFGIAEQHAFAVILGEKTQRQALGRQLGTATQGLNQGGGGIECIHHVFTCAESRRAVS